MLKAQCSQVQDRGGKNRWQRTQAKCRRISLISVRFLNNSNIFHAVNNVPQQRKLMRSSAQNSCGVHWSRRRVRFNEVLEKVPKVGRLGCGARSRSTGVWGRFEEALVQSQVKFNGFRRRFRRRFQEALASQVKFNGFWRRLQRRFRRRFWESLVQGQVMFKKGCGEVCFSSFCFSCLRCTLQKEL